MRSRSLSSARDSYYEKLNSVVDKYKNINYKRPNYKRKIAETQRTKYLDLKTGLKLESSSPLLSSEERKIIEQQPNDNDNEQCICVKQNSTKSITTNERKQNQRSKIGQTQPVFKQSQRICDPTINIEYSAFDGLASNNESTLDNISQSENLSIEHEDTISSTLDFSAYNHVNNINSHQYPHHIEFTYPENLEPFPLLRPISPVNDYNYTARKGRIHSEVTFKSQLVSLLKHGSCFLILIYSIILKLLKIPFRIS